MRFNTVEITSVHDLTQFSNLITKGVTSIPYISKLARKLYTKEKAWHGKKTSKVRKRTCYLDAH